jgi:predicted AAA+ superfamily ATPase
LLSEHSLTEFYSEWLDSFYARDVQEIFNIEKRQPFLKVLEFLLLQNGNLLEVTKFAKFAGISRPTAVKYLDVLEVTKAITIVRPFSGNKSQEIITQPRGYAFDTGICFYVQGHTELRSEDCGAFLENLTLECYQASGLLYPIHFWRTKQTQKEVDFVVRQSFLFQRKIFCVLSVSGKRSLFLLMLSLTFVPITKKD